MKTLFAFMILSIGLAAAQEGPKPKLLRKADLAGGDLSVTVWDHEIETRDGMLRCWTYVSRGMEKRGQCEIVFTLRRTPDLDPVGFPEEVFGLFEMIYGEAAKGRTVDDHGISVFSPGTTLLGREGNWGLIYLPAESFNGIAIPPNALTAVLVRDYETLLIQHGLRYRVATSMAGLYRYYPYPPWSDPDRPATVTEERFAKSILSRVPVRTMTGITAKIALEVSVLGELQPRMKDGQASIGSEIILSVDPKSLPDLKAAVDEIPKDRGCALLVDPDPDADSRLYWDPDSGTTTILNPPSGPGSWTTGGFILLGRGGKEFEDMIVPAEDGFALSLSPESWKKLGKALASGLPVDIPGKGDNISLRVEFAKRKKEVTGKAATMTKIVLFNTDAEFEKNGIGIKTFSSYIIDIGNAVSEVLEGFPELGAEGLIVAVAIKPGSKVKVWCESAEDDFDQAVLRMIEAELEKVTPPSVRQGTIAFSMSGVRWSGAEGGPPGFPRAWTDLITKANNPTMTFDEIIAALWKD